MAFKVDLLALVAELVYSEPLRISGELLTPTVTQWNQRTSSPSSASTWPASDQSRQHVTMCQVLQPPYSGPYQVLSQKEKTLQLLVRGRPITVSTDTVKPAYILNGTDRRNTTFNPAVDATLAVAPPAMPPSPTTQDTHSNHHVHFPTVFNI
jgi:hypothetical protein